MYYVFKGMESWNAIFNPLVTRPLTISEVVLEGFCQNKTDCTHEKMIFNYIFDFFCTG